MVYVRRDVSSAGSSWNEQLLWYARGVRALKKRSIHDPTSWRFLAAMHGFDPDVWRHFGYFDPKETLPSGAVRTSFWGQCQHQSWYFLPWHRGYVWAFEAIVRAAIEQEGGPQDWALPYWNYNGAAPGANTLPQAFTTVTMPDGSDNPLYVVARYGDGHGRVTLDPVRDIPTTALGDEVFQGGDQSVPPGFGGPKTIFHHGGEDEAPNGGIESLPHNAVHGAVGGSAPGTPENRQDDPKTMGLMAHPDQAALDPIFWLHHANVDRLWASWRQGAGNHDPSDPLWLDGPVGRRFQVPTPRGKPLVFSARGMGDTRAPNLNYEYEELTPLPPRRRDVRLARLTLPAPNSTQVVANMVDKPAEVIGSSETAIRLEGSGTDVPIRIDKPSRDKVAASLTGFSTIAFREPDRVFLKLENVRGANDAALFYVYVGLATDARLPEQHENFAGTLSFFGVAKATKTGAGHSGNGITQVFEITRIVDALHLDGRLGSLDQLLVRLVPRNRTGFGGQPSVGRISVLRKGA